MPIPGSTRRWAGPRVSVRALTRALTAVGKRCNLAVASVLFAFGFFYWVAVYCVVLPWLGLSIYGLLNLLVLTGCAGAALVAYFACLLLDPGSVPPGWQPDSEQPGAVLEVKRKDGAPRHCKKCNAAKPPRAHHCRVCRRCVLRMDHHCPWANNCIGHANYLSYLQLLVYSCAALLHTVALLLAHLIHLVRGGAATEHAVRLESGRGVNVTQHSAASADVSGAVLLHVGLQTFSLAVAVPAAAAVASLLVWHVRMVATNMTTIEHAEGVTAQIKSGGQPAARHPYDLGGCGVNARAILGEHPATWFLPGCAPTAGGLSYSTSWDAIRLGF